jgi:uncharacterized protein (TIGR02453 family)
MISKNITDFLKQLSENNNREWFNDNRKSYETAWGEFVEFTKQFILAVASIDKGVAYLEPKDCLFRIYRDVRFSTDKSPYKSNFGAYVVKGGKKSPYAGYYVHVDPTGNFLAGGIYMPMPDILKKVRTEIYENPTDFLSIIQSPSFVKHFSELDQSDKLKTNPKDFPKDFEHIDLLRHKSYTVSKNITDSTLHSSLFMNEIIDVFKTLHPFNNFINNAIDNN